MTIIPPITTAVVPLRMESSPNDGPTDRSSMILTGAGNAPARSIVARNFASSSEKFPSMIAFPFGIRERITGADCTTSSSTIARCLSIFTSVTRANIFPPSLLQQTETDR